MAHVLWGTLLVRPSTLYRPPFNHFITICMKETC